MKTKEEHIDQFIESVNFISQTKVISDQWEKQTDLGCSDDPSK
jgi:hypothetical protein